MIAIAALISNDKDAPRGGGQTMIYLEMSRDNDHGGVGWGFAECLWAPSRKENGGQWPFWGKVADVKAGDVVIHLKGKPPSAAFVGISTVAADGYETQFRPPLPKNWNFAHSFYRADLQSFTPFDEPIALYDVFRERRSELEALFDDNKLRVPRQNLFFVRQAGRLQCLNGAYLSDVDDRLMVALFGAEPQPDQVPALPTKAIRTSTVWAQVQRRVGQQQFARAIKMSYGGRCCFPDCDVDDPRFLVASHIARWADNEKLRGDLGNGLCLCLMHDRAFELGLFTVDSSFQVVVNDGAAPRSTVVESLMLFDKKPLREGASVPLQRALQEHWSRTGAVAVNHAASTAEAAYPK
jgi:hypothetical protein